MEYLEIQIECKDNIREILIAELDAIGYDAFMDMDTGIATYMDKEGFSKKLLDEILQRYESEIHGLTIHEVAKANWNEEWEKNYEPIVVDGKCIVRASFHQPDTRYPYDIVINPKMSFGTGHHETTFMMLKNILDSDQQGKKVLDAGCGTGVLAILAKKCGAREVHGFDIDEWAVENSRENILINNCQDIHVEKSVIRDYKESGFDTILANINKNVLLEEASDYYSSLKHGGQLFLSGFYEADIPDLKKAYESRGFLIKGTLDRNHWASLILVKE